MGDVCSLGVCSWTLCIVWATAMASTPPCVFAAGISCVSCSVAVSVAWSLSGDGDRPAGRMLSYSLQRCGGVLACARVILLCACNCANVTVVCDPACAIYLPCCICSLRLGESAACTCGLLVYCLQRRGSTPLKSSPVHHGLCFGRPRLFLSRVKSTVQEWRSASFSLLRMAPIFGTLSVFRSRFPLHCVTAGVPAFPRSVSTTDPPSVTSSYCLSMSTSGRPGLPADEGVRQGRVTPSAYPCTHCQMTFTCDAHRIRHMQASHASLNRLVGTSVEPGRHPSFVAVVAAAASDETIVVDDDSPPARAAGGGAPRGGPGMYGDQAPPTVMLSKS